MTPASREPTRRIAVVGVGNPERGDDAAGCLVVRRLRSELPPGIAVLQQSADVAELIQTLAGHHAVFIIDAVQTGTAQPGHVHRIDAQAGPLPAGCSDVSTHGFGVREAIELARTLGRLPPTVVIFGIEVAEFTLGRPPTNAVAAGMERVIDALRAEVGTVARPRPPCPEPSR